MSNFLAVHRNLTGDQSHIQTILVRIIPEKSCRTIQCVKVYTNSMCLSILIYIYGNGRGFVGHRKVFVIGCFGIV